MEASKRLVNLTYAVSTILTWIIFSKLFAVFLGTLGVRDAHLLGKGFTTSTLLAAAGALALLVWAWRHERIRPLAEECGEELVRVTWPSWAETKANTRIVVVVTLIISFILWVFDFVFGGLTTLILGGAT